MSRLKILLYNKEVIDMGLAENIARKRFLFHCNVVEGTNILSQFGVISGKKANKINKKHFYKAMDCIPYMSKKDIKKLSKKIAQ